MDTITTHADRLSPGTHEITVDGVRQVYHVAGDGPVCLVHPGGPGFGWEYLRLPGAERHATMVYLEPVGTGRSGRLSNGNYQIDTWARFIHGVVEHLALPRVFLLGHSYGGFVALRYALQHGDRLAGLVLYATAPALDDEFWAHAMNNLDRFPQRHPDRPEAAGIPQAYRAAMTAPDDDSLTLRLREILPFYFSDYWARERELEPVRAAMRAWVDPLPGRGGAPAPFDVRDALGTIAMPTLVIGGEHDHLCSPRWSEQLRRDIPGARLVVLPASGHMAHLETPEAFTAALADFVSPGPIS